MTKSLQTIALEMDRFAHDRELHLTNLLEWHRWPAGVPLSGRTVREIVRRHAPEEAAFVRFLSYNTYLTEAHFALPDPFPDLEIHAKPALHERATELGQVLFLDYDFMSLYEVMQEQQKLELLKAWGASPPPFVFGGTLSSLLTISQSHPIVRMEQHTFESKGTFFAINMPLVSNFRISLDSDFYAAKGVLLTEIDVGFGSIEIYSTHLMFGGGFPSAAEAAVNIIPGAHIAPSSPVQRFQVEMQQIDELIHFYEQYHRPDNVAIICGDFNIDGSNESHFQQLRGRMSTIQMRDAWAEGPYGNAKTGGQTARNDDGDPPNEADFSHVCLPITGDTGDLICDDTIATTSTSQFVGRFDYIFVEDPQPAHTCNLDLARVRRRGFKRESESAGQQYLSDHLGLETTLIVSRKK